MKKSRFLTVLLVMAILFTAVFSLAVLSACDDDEEYEYPVVGWQSYLDETAHMISDTFTRADGNFFADASFDVGGMFIADLKMNLYEDVSEKSFLDLALYYAADGSKAFRVFADNENIYTDNYKFPKAPLLDLLKSYGFPDSKMFSAENIRNYLELHMTACEVNADKSEYTFTFKTGDLFESGLLGIAKQVLRTLPDETLDTVYKFLGADSFESFSEKLKEITGKLALSKDNAGKISGVSFNLPGIIYITSSKFLINQGPSKMPEDTDFEDSVREEIKLGSLSAEGKMTFSNKSSGRDLVSYDFTLNCSLDLIKLISEGGRIGNLDDDNFFHLRIEHKCSDSCSDFCSVAGGNKYQEGRGAILDVAFSPADFGTHNIYISAAVRALLGENSVRSLVGSAEQEVRNQLRDYALITIDSNRFNDDTFNSKAFSEAMLSMLKVLGLGSSGAEISFNDLFDLIIPEISDTPEDGSLNIEDIVRAMFGVTGTSPDTISLSYEPPRLFMPQYYNIYNRAIHIIDNSSGQLKNYTYVLPQMLNPSISWAFDDASKIITSEGELEVHNIYSAASADEKIYGADENGNALLISPEEVKELAGSYIAYSSKDVYGSDIGRKKVRILEVYGVDYQNLSSFQTVKVKTELPSQWLHTGLNSKIKGAFSKVLYAYLYINLKLTPIAKDGVSLIRNDRDAFGEEKTSYRISQQSNNIHPLLPATATIRYDVDPALPASVKQLKNILGETDILSYTEQPSGYKYFINRTGSAKIRYLIAGMEFIKEIAVLRPDGNSYTLNARAVADYDFVVGNYVDCINYFRKYSVSFYYEGEMTEIVVPYENYYINGRSLSENHTLWSTSYTDSGKRRIKFNYAGSYDAQIRLLGQEFGLEISVREPSPTYSLTDSSSLPELCRTGTLYDLKYLLRNSTHGGGDTENAEIIIEILKLGAENEFETAVLDTDFYFSGTPAFDGRALEYGPDARLSLVFDIPQLILKPLTLNMRLQFAEPGTFRIKVTVLGVAEVITEIKVEN